MLTGEVGLIPRGPATVIRKVFSFKPDYRCCFLKNCLRGMSRRFSAPRRPFRFKRDAFSIPTGGNFKAFTEK